jgi:peptide deformylase
VETVDESIRRLSQDMIETMYAAEGIGLAAPQVGEAVAVCVVDVPASGDTDENGVRMNPDVPMPMTMINPVLVDASKETDAYEEGCLSLPGIRASVTRPAEITVRWTDLQGGTVVHHLRGMVARCVQHEMDHLRGVLICDRFSPVKKISMSGKLKRMSRETKAALGLLD